MKTPSLSALRVFEVAARHLSFSKAGDELFVTHAAVSHQIRNLEGWFEAKLFDRRGRSIALTRLGEMLFRDIAPALRDIEAACTRGKAQQGKDTLTVGCIPSIATRWLVPNLKQFMSTCPELDVRVVYATANQKLTDGGLDILITLGYDKAAHVSSKRIFSRITKPVCSPVFFKENGPLDTASLIASAPLLHDETRDGWKRWFLQAGTVWEGDDSCATFQDFNLLVTAAIAGHGVALCPVDTFRSEIERGDLIILSNVAINEGEAYFASSLNDAKPSVSAFLEWFVRLAQEGPMLSSEG